MNRRVVVVEYRSAPDRPWFIWGVYEDMPTLRSAEAVGGRVVPVPRRNTLGRRYPWTWTNEWGGEYRACQRVLIYPPITWEAR